MTTKFPKLVQQVFDYCVRLNKEGPYFTGSRAMGVETPQSDWDIVMEIPNEDIVSIANNMCDAFCGKCLNEGRYVVNLLNDRFVIEIYHTWLFGLVKINPKMILGVPQDKIDALFVPKKYADVKDITPIPIEKKK